MQRYPVVRVQLPNPFNYSRANNLGVSHAQGQYLLFLNNDTEVVSPDWIEQLVYYASQADVGAVGALLLYPNQTVQHVGVVLGMNAMADHVLRGFPVSEPVLDDALICVRERSAVTAACLMIKRSDYVQIGGFDQRFNTYFQDVDLCLRLRAIGKRNLVVPQAVLIHHESVTRKFEPDFGDGALMSERWGAVLNAPDPYFHPSYDRHALNLALLLAK
jgi:GT2 family glycosyltransferase